MIHGEHSMPLPLLNDHEFSQQSNETSNSTRSSPGVQIFAFTCELFRITGDILSTLYCNNGTLMPPATNENQHIRELSQIMAFNGQLDAYLISIPEFLRTLVERREQSNPTKNANSGLVARHTISCRYWR